MNLKSRPKGLSDLQAAASVGQNALMDAYSRIFNANKVNCGQVLLTRDDFSDRKRYLNAKNTLNKLLELGCVPVINENDAISTDEIKFGDNDQLSALVATLMDADLLIMLSDVDGLWDKDKKVIKIIAEISSSVKSLASSTDKKTSVGGMITKLEAAKISIDSGIPAVIANGRTNGLIKEIANDPASAGNWTLFLPKTGSLAAKERWIAFGTKPKGKIVVDDGAKRALKNKKSLLPVGVIDTHGNFASGEVVSIVDKDGNEFARGMASVFCRHLEEIKGKHSEKEVIHCDNLVIL